MDSIKPLFTTVGSVTAVAMATEAKDHSVPVNLSVSKAMGGPGRANTPPPEHCLRPASAVRSILSLHRGR